MTSHAIKPESGGLRACLTCGSTSSDQCLRCSHMTCTDCEAGGYCDCKSSDKPSMLDIIAGRLESMNTSWNVPL
jgi:hypothetical protein